MLLVDWIRKVTIGDNDAEDNTLRVSMDTSVADANQAEVDEARSCNELEMINQLKKMNMYLAMITGTKL